MPYSTNTESNGLLFWVPYIFLHRMNGVMRGGYSNDSFAIAHEQLHLYDVYDDDEWQL